MSAYGVCDEVVKRIDSGQYDLIVVNFANGDMVGHTGVLAAAVKAVEHVDICVGRILDAVQRQGGVAIVTADHGNCEQMIDPATGGPHTAHTTYDVELIVVDDRFKGTKLREGGRLADVAPTLLQMMGLPKPAEMTGKVADRRMSIRSEIALGVGCLARVYLKRRRGRDVRASLGSALPSSATPRTIPASPA